MKKRTFAKTALALTAATMFSLPAWATINMDTDVVVVGAGASGMAASVQAAQLGAKVVTLEKQAKNGGTGNFAEGIFACESSMQHRQGIIVTKEQAFKTIMDYSHWKANAPLVSAFVNKSGSTIDWLKDMGVKFEYIGPGGPGGVLTWHVIEGHSKAMIKTFTEQLDKLGGQLLLKTAGHELITENGKVVGVKGTTKDGEEIIVHAKAVIISTGGYANNKEMMEKYSPYPDMVFIGQIGKDGDGINMAWNAGAAEEGIHVMQSYRPGLPGYAPNNQMIAAAVQPYFWVDPKGIRYTDESSVVLWPYAGNALERLGGKAFSIYDENTKNMFIDKGIHMPLGEWVIAGTKLTDLPKELDKAIAKGDVVKANTIPELAKQLGMDPKVLQASVDKNNEMAAAHEDNEYYKQSVYLRSVAKPPYYATRLQPRALGTLGGVKINEHTQAISKTTGEPIDGLFVTGNDAGGIYGDSYDLMLGGGTLGFAVNSGRIAAESAVKFYVKK
ncbi:FAD-binding protein [Shewanella avicenniae]|uniref:FAD-binding protein n=1 Tax=Shewanella avicenniae TaxID=2814294 RepID=A0ABX7QS43_9GAMM|nr:FAD-dependent oxidoreductase [Shewanella avicenniae]QSX33862.1 FAD-binding protein [Shewanella avicenniae]